LLNNHYEIYVLYHTKDNTKYRVVGVFVNPSSTESKTCEKVENDKGMILAEDSKAVNQVTYTYDVYWLVRFVFSPSLFLIWHHFV
jgi:transmembrane 9 superfamily protein 2/4